MAYAKGERPVDIFVKCVGHLVDEQKSDAIDLSCQVCRFACFSSV